MNDYKIVATPSNNSFDLATASFVWTGTSSNFEVMPTATNTIILHAAGTYTATVTTLDGCVASLPIVIADVSCSIQKGISPNDDGDNETFDLTSFNVKDIKIFNRYGTQVYELENYTNQWHGQSNDGSTLSDGTYFYVIQKGDNSTVTGWVYINK
jgi:gliding motility-associated-like protein